MIVRFDEILTNKYNKMDQAQFETEVHKAYETKIKVQQISDSLDHRTSQLMERTMRLEDERNQMLKKLSAKTEDLIEQKVSLRMQEYDRVLK